MRFSKEPSKLRTDRQLLQCSYLSSTASSQYARATKAVSLIPPAYYADLACERARLYLNDLLNLGLETASSAGGKKFDKKAEEKKTFDRAVSAWGQGIHPNLCETMFYI